MQVLISLKLPAKIENLRRLVKSVADCARAQGFDQKKISKIELATEETLVNIFRHSYPETPAEVEINCKVDGIRFIIEVIDSGLPFDMASVPAPDVTADISERKLGGLGILIIKKMMDEVKYRRESDRNILTLITKKDEG
jgi:anti-sigma regulatory factor (Ser/Thr protein kinase)